MGINVVKQAQSWLGKKESDGSYKIIIDTYNAHKPLARGYKVKYTDEWCATFVSAVAIKCGLTDIIPTECSCGQMIELFKSKGCWQEKDDYIPSPGDILFYDWEDTGIGDNVGYPDHVGIVEEVKNNTLTVIEGNKNEVVARRILSINGKYIRGYGVPKYKLDNTPGEYAKEAVNWAVKNGILKGNQDGNYLLHSNVSTERMLVFLHRALKK